MPAVKDLSRSADKWKRRASVAAPDYEAGIDNPRTSWEESTLKAADSQAKGVQQAIANKSFEKGIKKAGNAKWQQRAKQLGAQRFAEGVAVAEDAYKAGFQPYKEAIERVSLPPKGPKGDPRNYARVAAIGEALRKVKTG